MSLPSSREASPPKRKPFYAKHIINFNKTGGLSEHVRILKEIIMIPLLYDKPYSKAGVKAPQGIIFNGPSGNGKTLVANALAHELSKEGQGKVQFFQKKASDFLDQRSCEPQKALRTVFELAIKGRPSVIFIDELDNLVAPRSAKSTCSYSPIVKMLIQLMDAIKTVPGVVVIGATNRLDAIEPALRKFGRFDRELYFPIPCTLARKEILQVHLQMWTHKPSLEYISHLANTTGGFSGANLQTLCSEAFTCCLRRTYPNMYRNRNSIDKEQIVVKECDFETAKMNMVSRLQKIKKRSSSGRKTVPAPPPLKHSVCVL